MQCDVNHLGICKAILEEPPFKKKEVVYIYIYIYIL